MSDVLSKIKDARKGLDALRAEAINSLAGTAGDGTTVWRVSFDRDGTLMITFQGSSLVPVPLKLENLEAMQAAISYAKEGEMENVHFTTIFDGDWMSLVKGVKKK